jgi:hypothetical protein
MLENALFSYYTSKSETSLLDHDGTHWRAQQVATIDRDWQGQSLIKQKGVQWKNLTRVASLWNERTLFLQWECWYDELNLNLGNPGKTTIHRLWETDVVEVFLRPESCEDYFEIEISPLGQWLDVHIIKPRTDVDFNWNSKISLRASISKQRGVWRVNAAIPFQPILDASRLLQPPAVGHSWRLNLYRMAGKEPEREFLAWRPTFTQLPDFHVPSSFGNLFFLEEVQGA